jgi:hypothetical protein
MSIKQVLFCLLFLSCNSNKNGALRNLISLYDGRFTMKDATRQSPSNEKENYIKLTSSKNGLVEEGWLSPDAMANNCAILFFRSNPLLFEDKDLLEIEIQIENSEPLVFKYKPFRLKQMANAYDSIEIILKDFVENTVRNNKSKVNSAGYIPSNQQEQNFDSFFETFSNTIPDNYKDTKLISYTIIDNGLTTEYLVDGALITYDNIQKMINVRLIRSNNEIKIKEVKF